MTLRNLDKLDLVGIRSMLEKNGEAESLENLITAVLAYCQKFEAEGHIPVAFFKGLTITTKRIEQMGDYNNVLRYLIYHRIVDFSSVQSLALRQCNINDLFRWCREGLLNANELLLSILNNQGLCCAITASLDASLPNIDYPLFLQHVVETYTSATEVASSHLSSIARLFTEIDYTSYHDEMARILSNSARARSRIEYIKAIFTILNHFFDREDILAILPTRIDIILLYDVARNYLENSVYSPKVTKAKVDNLKEKILFNITQKHQYSYLALYDHFFPFNDLAFSLVNEWAANNDELAFSIYSGYLLNEKRDYENEGKALDEAYLHAFGNNKNIWQRLRSKSDNISEDE